MDEKAEPCAFLHVRQWQCTIGPAGASTSYATLPHMQLPMSKFEASRRRVI
jgi:hypothetical protein